MDYEKWAAETGPTALYARGLVLTEGAEALDVVAPAGAVTRLAVPDGADEHGLAHVLVGRTRAASGELVVHGLLLPEQREQVNRVATVVDLGRSATDAELETEIRDTARLTSSSHRAQREHVDRTVALVGELDAAIGPGSPHTMRAAVVQAAQAAAGGVATVVVAGLDDLLLAQDRYRAERLADALAERGLGVVLLLTHEDQPRGTWQPTRVRSPCERAEDESQEETVVHD